MNFIDLDSELKKIFILLLRKWSHLVNLFADNGVTSKFNPSSASHFNGK